MSLTCNVVDCKNLASFYCNCSSGSMNFCNLHVSSHQMPGQNQHEILSFPLKSEILNYISSLSETESRILKMTLKIIKKIQSESEKILKKISKKKSDLYLILTPNNILSLDQKKIIEKHLKTNLTPKGKKMGKILNFVEKKLENKTSKLMKTKILCLECKTGYFCQCGEHLMCDYCRICYCKACKTSTTYSAEDFKGHKLITEKDPVRSSNDLELSISTSFFKGINNTLSVPVSFIKINSKTSKFVSFNLNILKFLSKKLPSFISVFGSNTKPNEVVIVTEHILSSLSEVTHNILPFTVVYKIAKGLIEGFAYMSFYKIYHRRICLDSILLTQDMTPKIHDFNLAILHSTDIHSDKINFETLAQGKDGFLSPERWKFIKAFKENRKFEVYNIEKSEVFSLGLVLLSLFTQFSCVYDLQKCEDKAFIKDKTEKIGNSQMEKLVKRMLHPVPANRPYLCQVLDDFNKILFKDVDN